MIREIKPLTGIRGIAALWVVACHWSGSELTGIAKDVALHGNAAVDIFMILSGFVLALTYREREPYFLFLARRLCRLYPLYLLTTLAFLALDHWVGPREFGLADLASNLLLTDTHLWEVNAIDGPSWVVSVEFTLNLFLPLFVFLCLRQSWRRNTALAVLCFAILVAVSVLNHRWDNGVAGELGTLDTRLMYFRCGPEFALGMLCWRLWREIPWATALGRPAVLAPTILAMLAMTPFKSLDLPFVVASCILIVGLATEQGWIAAVLGSRIPHWLGTISYSVYLWHEAYLPLREGVLPSLPAGNPGLMIANTLGLAAVLVFSTLSFRWFETPVRKWTNGILPKSPHPVRIG